MRYFILVPFFFFSCSQEARYKTKPGDNLYPVKELLQGDDLSFSNPNSLAWDKSNFFYVSDPLTSTVHKFNLDGVPLSTIGRYGRGPGEFEYQITIASDTNGLFVQDGNNRLVLFTNQDFDKILNQRAHFLDFDVHNNNFFGFNPVSFLESVSVRNDSLINVYDENGLLINQFGSYLEFDADFPKGLSWPYIEVEDELVHVVFQYFSIYRVYSLEGKLLLEKNLSELIPDLFIKEISKNDIDFSESESKTQFEAVFRAMDVIEGRIFIARQAHELLIDELLYNVDSARVSFVKSNRFSDVSDYYYLNDFFYNEKNSSFYVLEQNKVPKITVYKELKVNN